MITKLKQLKSDPILGIVSKFKMDNNPKKINLSIGEFVNKSNVYKFRSVNKIERSFNINYRYLPIQGCSDFIEKSRNLVYGSNNNHLGYQTISGTGSLWLANQILNLVNLKNVVTADITWPNHNQIFNIIDTYKYSTNLDNLLMKINESNNNVFLFQSCCHNPTGIDYCQDNWDTIATEIKKYNHTVIMDNAYQGLASGNPQVDNYSIKAFDKMNIPMIVCSSYAKNFGLYNQRLGSLFTNFKVDNLDDYIKKIIRSSYSNPPSFGTLIFNKIIEEHYDEWEMECLDLTKQLKKNREKLYTKLKNKNITWDNLVDGNGLFYLTPLNEYQINKLSQEHSIYMLKNGRINIAGINENNIDYIVDKISGL